MTVLQKDLDESKNGTVQKKVYLYKTACSRFVVSL